MENAEKLFANLILYVSIAEIFALANPKNGPKLGYSVTLFIEANKQFFFL